MPLVVCGSILARNEFKLFAGVSCIKGSFLSKTQALGLFLVLQFPNGEVEKRNYLITTIIIWNGPEKKLQNLRMRMGGASCRCLAFAVLLSVLPVNLIKYFHTFRLIHWTIQKPFGCLCLGILGVNFLSRRCRKQQVQRVGVGSNKNNCHGQTGSRNCSSGKLQDTKDPGLGVLCHGKLHAK